MKHTFILTSILTFFLFQLNAQVTTISGVVKNPTAFNVGFEWEDKANPNQRAEMSATLNGANEFTVKLPLKTAGIVELKYGTKSKKIYIEPGDQLKLQFDAPHFGWSFSFSGKGSQHNIFLNLYEKEFGQYSDNYLIYEMAQRSHEDYRQYMDKLHQDKWAYFRTNSHYSFSTSFRNYMKAEVDYWWAYNLLRYRFENPKANLRPAPSVLPKNYYTFLDKAPVQNEAALGNEYYQKFILEYLQYRADNPSTGIKKFTAIVESNQLSLRDEPKTGSKITSVSKGTVLQYLKERSKEKSKIYTRGKVYYKPWIKVRTPDGYEGWVFEGGVEFERSSDPTPIGKLAASGRYLNASKHLKGKVLEYYVAEKLSAGSGNVSKRDFKIFMENAQSAEFRNDVAVAYKKRYNEDISGALAGNNATGNVPDNNSSAATTTPIANVPNYVMGVPKSTKISGKIENPTFRSIIVKFYKDQVSFEEEEFMLQLDGNNGFSIDFKIDRPTLAKLIYGEDEATLFLEPGNDLTAEFSGGAFLWSLDFKGKGAAHNNFLKKYNDEFGKYTENYIFYELAHRNPSNFRLYMDRVHQAKWTFYKNYNNVEKRGFTKEFVNYATAEIDYWWAFNLMRYRWEHPVANDLPSPMTLPGTYYDFLSKIEINNDDAINSRQYLYFIGLYLKLRRENPGVEVENQVKQLVFRVEAPSVRVRVSPENTLVLHRAFKGDRLKYLYERSKEKTKQSINGETVEDYSYKVRTPNGEQGWVFGGAGKLKEPQFATGSVTTVEVEEEVTKSIGVATVDRLRVRKSPQEPNAIAILDEGSEMEYLGRKSSQRYTFTLRGVSHNDHFYKIRTASGQVGWVFGGGMDLREKTVKEKRYRTQTVPGSYGNAAMFLTGKVLHHTIAKSIYWKSKNADIVELEQEVNKFKMANPHPEYDKVVSNALYEAKDRAYKMANNIKEEAPKPFIKDGENGNVAASTPKTKPTPQPEKPKVEAPKEDVVVATPPKPTPQPEKPKVEAPKEDVVAATPPKPEPQPEKPKVETPKEDVVAATPPKSTPQPEKPKVEEPKEDVAIEDSAPAESEASSKKPKKPWLRRGTKEDKPEPEVIAAEEKVEPAATDKEAIDEEVVADVVSEKEDSPSVKPELPTKDPKGTIRETNSDAGSVLADKAEEKPDEEEPKVTFVAAETPAVKTTPDLPTERSVDDIKKGRVSEFESKVLDCMSMGMDPKQAEQCARDYFMERDAEEKRRIAAAAPPDPVGTVKVISASDILEQMDLTPIQRTQYPVKLKGKITGTISKGAKVILYPDPVSMKEVEYSIYVKSDGTFQTVLNITEPTVGKLVYGVRHTEIYLEPGDELDVSFSGDSYLETIEFKGKGSHHNAFIKSLRTDFRFKDSGAKSKIYGSSPPEYKKFMKDAYEQKLSYYEKQKGGFSSDFDAYIKGDIDYWYAYYMLNYRWEHPLQYGDSEPMKININGFYDFLDAIPIVNDGALPNQYYSNFIDIFLDDKSREPANKGLTTLELGDKYLSGEVLYYLKAKRLTTSATHGDLGSVIFDIKMFMDECAYPPYRESIKKTLKNSNGLLRGMDAPDFDLIDMNGKPVSLQDYRGKIVYLDFWATWCQSCIHQIQNSTYLKRKFNGKEVVFIYVSVDNTSSEWRQYVRDHNLPGTHLYANGALNSKVANDYAVKKLPAVFLIDQNGIIAQSPAKLPDQPGIVEQISALLQD